MGKKLPHTPSSRIHNALRQVWLRSRERAAAIKLHDNTCLICRKKGSQAKGREVKIEVHHRNGIDWAGVVQLIRDRILQQPEDYDILCQRCHDKVHGRVRKVKEEEAEEPSCTCHPTCAGGRQCKCGCEACGGPAKARAKRTGG